MELPGSFAEKMERLLGPEYPAFMESLGQERHYGVRVNGLKIKANDLFRLLGRELSPVPWSDDGFYYTPGDLNLSKSPFYAAGLYYIQEPSAMSAAPLLGIRPGMRVLDLCAAPGGKSCQAGAALGNRGVLVSNDATSKRIPPLVYNIEHAGITNCVVTNETPERLAEVFPLWFDRILCDAPCSGEGMFRKDSDAILAWDKNKSARLNEIQNRILHYAGKMLKEGGLLVYSTCTFAPEENEMLVKAFLAENLDFALEAIDHKARGLSPGRGDWAEDVTLNGAARIWPHKQRGEGHFTALLRRISAPEIAPTASFAPQMPKEGGLWEDFCKKNMVNLPGDEKRLHRQGDFLMLAPEGLCNPAGLRVVRNGLLLGKYGKNRFEPAAALGLAGKKEDFLRSVDFAPDAEKVTRYLKGEAFPLDTEDGYNLFCVEGYPLGLVKVLKGRLKGRADW